MRTGRPVAKIELSAEVAGILEGYTQRRKTAQALALRARIVLGCAAGLSNKAVAAHERVTPQTVGKWRRRFVERGLDGLLDEPRPGVPRKTAGSHALEHAQHGPALWHLDVECRADLACLRAAAAPPGDVQAVH
jgi:transposase-like protein